LKRTPHIVSKKTRAGIVWYVYAWRGGPQVHRSEGAKRPRIDTDIARRIAAADEADNSPDPTTLLAVIRDWRHSPEWAHLADTTKKTWGSALDRIEEKWGDVPLAIFDDRRMKAKVVAWRDGRSSTPRAADIGITVLHALLKNAVLKGLLTINVAAGIPTLYRGGDRAEVIWTDNDLKRFEQAALRTGEQAALDGLLLAVMTGLRREDLVTLLWSEVTPKAILKRAKKVSRRKRYFATVPTMGPALKALLAELRTRQRGEGVETVLVDQSGKPWSPDRFTKAIARVRDEAGIVHVDPETGRERKLHLHDARGTFATRLMLAKPNISDKDVADLMGWSPENVARIRHVYVDQSAKVVAMARRLRGAL